MVSALGLPPATSGCQTKLGRGLLQLVAMLLVLLGTVLFAPSSRADDTERAPQPVRVVIDDNYPPYSFKDSQGKLQGILIDYWKLWETKNGTPVEITGLDWRTAIDRMRLGEFDVIDTIFVTEERKSVYTFSPAYLHIEVPIFFHKDLSGINDLDSIRAFNVATKSGDAALELLRTNGVKNIQVFPNYESIIQAAKARTVQIFVVDRPAALYFLHKYDLADEFRESPAISQGDFHRAYLKSGGTRMAFIEAGFARISRGELEEIQTRWLGSKVQTVGSSMRYLIYVTCAALLIATILIIWNQLLRWQVNRRTRDLAASEKRFRDTIAFIPTPLAIIDVQGRVHFFNRAFTDCLGYTTDDTPTVREWFEKAYPDPEYRESVATQWRIETSAMLSHGQPMTPRGFRIADKAGIVHEMEISMRALDDLFLTTFSDVTERNRFLSALRQSEQRYRRLHESLQDAYVRVDMQGHMVDTNKSFRELTGYDEEELSHLNYRDITPPQWHEMENRLIKEQLLVRGYTDVYEKEYRCKDGRVIPIELRTFAIRDENGDTISMWALIRDLSERRRMAEQHIQSQKLEAIGQLAGGVAHDFNNILASMLLNVGLMQDEAANNPEWAHSLQDLRTDISRASELTRQLLTFSRSQTLKTSAVNIHTLLPRIMKMLRHSFGERYSLVLHETANIPPFAGNEGMIEQAIVNLCINARDAMPNGGAITLSNSVVSADASLLRIHPECDQGSYLKISIQDQGNGISDEHRKRIFEPFFTTKPQGKGTGLGLSIVFGIIRQHGGWVDTESVLGHGATFHIFLPLRPLSPGEQTAPAPMKLVHSGRGQHILLVEDEDNVRKVLSTGLTRLGYHVEAAASPEEALQLWQNMSKPYDLLLTDMVMPGELTGLDLAKTLHARNPAMKIILSSGYNKELLNNARPLDLPLTTLPKPYTLEQLSVTLHEVFL